MKKYSLDFISENEIRNNTHTSKIPLWAPEQINISEGTSKYSIDMALSLTKISLMFEGIELSDSELDLLKKKYYSNI